MAKVKEEVKEEVLTSDIKEEIDDYIKERTNYEVESSIKKLEKKVASIKNGKIIRRDIVIVLLVGIIIYGVKTLYDDGYFKKYINVDIKEDIPSNEVESNTIEESKKEEKVDYSKYEYLFDNIIIDTNNVYLDDLYDGNLTTELKLSIAFNLVKDKVSKDEEYYYIYSSDLKEAYETIFNDEYTDKSFKIGEYTFKYIKVTNMYITDEYKENKDYITREITNIKESKNKIEVTTLENNHTMLYIFTDNYLTSIESIK